MALFNQNIVVVVPEIIPGRSVRTRLQGKKSEKPSEMGALRLPEKKWMSSPGRKKICSSSQEENGAK